MEVVNEGQKTSLWLTVALTFFMLAALNAWFWLTSSSHQSSDTVYWYLSRSAGLVAYAQLTIMVYLGLTSSSGWWDKLRLRRTVTQIHQFLGVLILPFIAVHIWATHLDAMVPFPWPSVFEPFQSSFKPIFVGFGVLASYGLLVILLTSMFRERIGVKAWRWVHYLSIPVYIMVTLHGMVTGTDTSIPWITGMYIICLGLFLLLIVYRIQVGRERRPTKRTG